MAGISDRYSGRVRVKVIISVRIVIGAIYKMWESELVLESKGDIREEASRRHKEREKVFYNKKVAMHSITSKLTALKVTST